MRLDHPSLAHKTITDWERQSNINSKNSNLVNSRIFLMFYFMNILNKKNFRVRIDECFLKNLYAAHFLSNATINSTSFCDTLHR